MLLLYIYRLSKNWEVVKVNKERRRSSFVEWKKFQKKIEKMLAKAKNI